MQEKIPQSSMTYFQVDMNVITPTPPHPNPTPNDPDAYSIAMHTIQSYTIHVCSSWHESYYPHATPTPPQMIFYCGFLHACMVLLGHRVISIIQRREIKEDSVVELVHPTAHNSTTNHGYIGFGFLCVMVLHLGIYGYIPSGKQAWQLNTHQPFIDSFPI